MTVETILKLYLPTSKLPVSGTFQSHSRDMTNSAEYCIRRIFMMEFLETKGYSLKPAEVKTLSSIEGKVKHYWFTSISIRWKDFGNEEVNAFQHIDFEELFKESPEFQGYHTGNNYGV